MLNFTAMIQGIDTIFTNLIFIPALLILYLKFRRESPGADAPEICIGYV